MIPFSNEILKQWANGEFCDGDPITTIAKLSESLIEERAASNATIKAVVARAERAENALNMINRAMEKFLQQQAEAQSGKVKPTATSSN